MDFLALYRHRKYHQIIVCASLCITDLDTICLYLSLVGIGRTREAVITLRAKLESTIDPFYKICVLLCLHQLTGLVDFDLEAQYWQSLSDFDDRVFRMLTPLPQSTKEEKLEGDIDADFFMSGAFFHPHSYLFTSLEDRQVSSELHHSKSCELVLLLMIAKCGSTVYITEALRLKKMKQYFQLAEERCMDAVYVPCEDITKNLIAAQEISALAGYHHLLGSSSKALDYCTRAILWINSIRLEYGTSHLRGILDYEKETLAMIASNHLSESTGDTFVESLLNELIYPESSSCPGNRELDPITNSFHQVARATSLRQSLFFASCGNIHRAMADFSSTKLLFVHKNEMCKGKIFSRKDMLETARKYVLSSALQPVDNPCLALHYDRLIWCLMFSGGIDLRVILLFFTIKLYFLHQLFFTLSEHSSDCHMMIWPPVRKAPEIMDKLLGMCLEVSKIEHCEPKHLLPTTIECDNDILLLENYIRDPQSFVLDKVHDIDNLNCPQEPMSDTELCHLMSSSQEIAELWSSTFCKSQGAVPEEIRQVTKYLDV